jgi:hypothetical protein
MPWRASTTRGLDFLALYQTWLEAQGLEHSSGHFRQWAAGVYERPEELSRGGPEQATCCK